MTDDRNDQDAAATNHERTAVERAVELDATVEEVWHLLATADGLSTWLGAEVELDVRAGGTGRVIDHDGRTRAVEVHTVDPTRRLAWRWHDVPADRDRRPPGGPTPTSSRQPAPPPAPPSMVELTLTPTDAGTLVRVVEVPVGPAPPTAAATASASAPTPAGDAWAHRLLHLEALLLVAAAIRG